MATTSIPHRWKYDVFVSFRGEDIRKTFMDHLFEDFRKKGIHAFRDDNELPRGKEISFELYKAIEESRFLIVIFSKNYASSSWCLRELVKILECKGMHEHHVRIIFYDVKPTVVRNQTESYAEAFDKHEFSNRTEVAKWKEALSMAADLSGWDLQDMTNGYESKFIGSISTEIFEKLCKGPLHVGENLVGIDAHVNKLNLLRFVGSSKVHMIGICGISGIGKTTLAKAIYKMMYPHFEECCFCEKVQEVTKRQGLTQVQMQLIGNIMKTRDVKISNVSEGTEIIKQRMASKPILLVLDDVDHREQLEALAGSPDWFFPGSLIIFTGEDKQLLHSYKVDDIHEMPNLHDDEALELFSLYAFRKKLPTKDFKELAYQVVKCLQGHPLALKVVGCSLYEKHVHVWESERDRLQTYPNVEIQQKLRPSFDVLDFDQKRIFLDIACSLNGENKDFAASVLDSSNCFADANIEALVDKSLITISPHDMSLQMHDLIQSMAREIIREESNRPGNRNRLLIPPEGYDVLVENKVTEAVEVLVLLLEKSSQKVHIESKAFAHMKKLRLLKICQREPEDYGQAFELKLSEDFNVKFSGSLAFLSNKLRLLYWHGYPFKFLPSDFYPENIVAIDLSYSHIKNLWTTPKCFRRLKVMKLRHCRNLTSTPDFTEITNLEELILEGCVNLVKVHPSIGMLKRLVVLNVRNCIRLRSFPCLVEMDSLQVLIFSGCSKVDKLHKVFGTVKTLAEVPVAQTAIMEFPYFVFSLTNLQVLSVGIRRWIESRWWTSNLWPSYLRRQLQQPPSLVLPSLASLRLLRSLDVSYCNISEVSPDIGGLSCLKYLKMNGNNFTSLPASLSKLSRLTYLNVGDCNISEVSPDIGGLSCLEYLELNGNNFTSLPASLSKLSRLTSLHVDDCKKLEVLPESPPNIDFLSATHCTSLRELANLPVNNNNTNKSWQLTGCPKLDENIKSLLPSSLLSQGLTYLCNRLDIIICGNEIPLQFTNQSMGNNVKVELPPGWCYNKFWGYKTYAIFKPKKSCSYKKYHKPGYFVYDEFENLIGVEEIFFWNTETIQSDVTWLHYLKRRSSWMEAKNFITFSFRGNRDFEVKECGVRLVCDEDIQEEMGLSMFHGLPTLIHDSSAFLIRQDSSSIDHEHPQFHEYPQFFRHIAWSRNREVDMS